MSTSPIPSPQIPLPMPVVTTEEQIPEFLQEFDALFAPGNSFDSIGDLRSTVSSYGQKHNVVMSTKNSNYRSIHLWCKHAGVYRKSNKNTNQPTKTVKSRKKETQRTDCKCFIKAKLVEQKWLIERSYGNHNHAIPTNCTVYSLHRRQSEPVKELILQLLNNGQKISSILEYLHMMGIRNIIKKDIENLQQHFRRKKLKEEQDKSVLAATMPLCTDTLGTSGIMSAADMMLVPTPTHKLFTENVLATGLPDNTQHCISHNTPAAAFIPRKILPYTTHSAVNSSMTFKNE